MRKLVVTALVAVGSLGVIAQAMTEDQRRAHLDWMLKTLPEVPSWAEWQKKTGALPPDFDALPSANFLPDPFKFHDGRPVKMPSDWAARRAEIRQLYEKHLVGSLPPKPKLDRIVPVEETKGSGYITRVVRLEYGPQSKITTQVTLTLPEGGGPFPVLLGGGGSSASLIRRGYAACEYPASVDQPSELPQLYPDFDFATMGQRAWTVQLVVDYLHTLPEIDKARIAITGYSRGGKMATIAAAFDERIAAVIAGSTGVGGVLPWRLSGERGMGEGIESTTRMFPLWFAPQARFFSGREDRLPVDANLLVALVAPRACLMNYGLNDEVSNVWGNEQCYHSALKVYAALGQPDRLGVLRLPGFHGANDVERCLDWLDLQFGRTKRTWRNDVLFPWSYDEWRKTSGSKFDLAKLPARPAPASSLADLEKNSTVTRKAVAWLLGETPPTVPAGAGRGGRGGPPGRGPTATATKPVANPGQLLPDVAGWVIGRNSQEFGWNDPDRSAADSRRIRFGAGITGDLYFPAGSPAEKKLPTVIWLHGYSYPLGYMWVYRRDLHPILALVKAGYAVLAFDQCGFGARMAEIGPFYDRTPRWSQLGRMIDDTRAAIDALEKEPGVDAQRISLFGYTLGGAVALHAAALDPRVKSVVAVSGFTPMRTDTAARPTGGLARFSVERPLVPQLGLFIGREKDVPYDYDDLLAVIAPRPVLIVQPSMDRDATPADVRAAVGQARKAYALHGAADKLGLDEPHDYQRLPAVTQNRAIEWMAKNLPHSMNHHPSPNLETLGRNNAQQAQKPKFSFFAPLCAFLRPLPALAFLAFVSGAAAQNVTLTETATLYTLDNGIVTARVAKASGDLVSLRYKNMEMLATFVTPDGEPDLEKDPPGENLTGLNRGMTDHQYGFWSHDAMGPKNTVPAVARVTIDPKSNSGARGEISVKGISGGRKMGTGPGSNAQGQFIADVEIRYALGRGDSGVYTYSIFEHKPDYGTTTLGEARVCFKLNDFFDWMLADDTPNRNKLYPKTLRENKYNYTTLQSENPAFGWASTEKKVGFFIVNPTLEYMSGGPTKVEFLCHRDTNAVAAPCVLNYWRSSHYGGANVTVAEGEHWTKVIGPIFLYVTGGADPQAIRRDALAQQKREAGKWPYDWVAGVDFPASRQRSTVSGQLAVQDPARPGATTPRLQVGLTHAAYGVPAASAPGAGGGPRQIDWQTDAKFYQFWARGGDDGRFSIPHVRPGTYTLHAFADGVLGEFTRTEIKVEAGKPLDLGKLSWTPVRRGRQLWEIGIPNRTAREFFKGDDYFHDGMPVQYAKLFPKGTHYVVGQSDFRRDWYYQHVPQTDAEGIAAADAAAAARASAPRPAAPPAVAPVMPAAPATSGAPAAPGARGGRGGGLFGPPINGAAAPRAITFDVSTAPKGGKATLRLAICGVGTRTLDVTLNDQPVGSVQPMTPDSTFGMGNGIQGLWNEREIAFDAKLLKPGTNVLKLTIPAGPVTAGVIYDYLRLELDESAQ